LEKEKADALEMAEKAHEEREEEKKGQPVSFILSYFLVKSTIFC
jgi:hypothetical protein